MKHLLIAFACIFLLYFVNNYKSSAQTRGLIFEPSTTTVLDPNSDGYISQNPAGFIGGTAGTGYSDVPEFESLGWFKFPTIGVGEKLSDIRSGPDEGFTDFSVDNEGAATYIRNDGTNLIFRFRLADFRPNAKGYTVLMDIDNHIGTDDPDASGTYGFEVAITLLSKHGVFVYDLRNAPAGNTCSNVAANYPLSSHHQKAISGVDSPVSGDLDVFYDFYIPISILESTFGINVASSSLRLAATTNTSNSCTFDGSISDVGGVDDSQCPNPFDCLVNLVETQCT